MAFLAEELRNFASKGWLGILGTGDRNTAPDNFAWYEEITTLDTIVKPVQLWNQLSSVGEAADLATAQANAVANPTIIQDLSAAGSAIHLTPSPNNKTFFATTVYGDLSTKIGNWIMPQLIPRTDPGFEGFPSIGYMITLWNDDPATVGTPIGTSVEQSGAVPGWFMNFGAGAIKVASSFTGITDPTKVYMTGFRYIGTTGGSGGGSSIVDEYDVRNETGGALNAYTVVKGSGDNNVQTRILIDACSSLSDMPIGVLPNTINDTTNGVMKTFGRMVIVGFDTTGATIGDPVFFNASGNLTLSRGSYQIGQVMSLAANGVIYLNIKEFVYNDFEEINVRTVTVDNVAGSDITGDGSVASPFASPKRALQNIGSVISASLAIEFVNTGVAYNWDDTNVELNRFKRGIGGSIRVRPVSGSEYTTVETNSMTANTHFTHTRAGAGWAVDTYVGAQLVDSSDSEIFTITKNDSDTLYCSGSNWFVTKPINNYTIRTHNIVFESTEAYTINVAAKVDWTFLRFDDVAFNATGNQFMISGSGNIVLTNCYCKIRSSSTYTPNTYHYRCLFEGTLTVSLFQLDALFCGFRFGSNQYSMQLFGRASGHNYYYRPTGTNVGTAMIEDNFRVYNHPAMDVWDCAYDNFAYAFDRLYYQGVIVPTGTFDFSGCKFILNADAGARHVTSHQWGAPILSASPTVGVMTTDNGVTETDTLYEPDRNINALVWNVSDAKTPVYAGYTPQIIENGNRFLLPYGLMGFLIEELILDDGIFIIDGQLIIEE